MYTNEQVATLLKGLTREVAGLRAELRAATGIVGTVEAASASAPVVIPARDEKAEKVVFTCKGHGVAGANVACAREFGKVESLNAHNAWAHKS